MQLQLRSEGRLRLPLLHAALPACTRRSQILVLKQKWSSVTRLMSLTEAIFQPQGMPKSPSQRNIDQ